MIGANAEVESESLLPFKGRWHREDPGLSPHLHSSKSLCYYCHSQVVQLKFCKIPTNSLNSLRCNVYVVWF